MKQQNMCIIICEDKIWHNNKWYICIYLIYIIYSKFSQKVHKNGKNEICCIRRWHINKYEKMRKITNMQI